MVSKAVHQQLQMTYGLSHVGFRNSLTSFSPMPKQVLSAEQPYHPPVSAAVACCFKACLLMQGEQPSTHGFLYVESQTNTSNAVFQLTVHSSCSLSKLACASRNCLLGCLPVASRQVLPLRPGGPLVCGVPKQPATPTAQVNMCLMSWSSKLVRQYVVRGIRFEA
jgi:hypothetical protein